MSAKKIVIGLTVLFLSLMSAVFSGTAGAEEAVAEVVLERSSDLEEWEDVTISRAEVTGSGRIRLPEGGDAEFFRIRTGYMDEVPRPTGFVSIPAGAYLRGDHKDDPEFYMERSRPVHEVETSAFSIGESPVTYHEWREVYDWAVANGYAFENPGQRGSDNKGNGLPDTHENGFHPVVGVNWYDVVKWCNAKSEMEGRAPFYHTDEEHQSVYRAGVNDLSAAQVRWDADGYRLSTEVEWEKAARGGLEGKRWAWGEEEIGPRLANYERNASGTTEVGAYPPNGHGLFDAAGNVFEWCWDWYDENWYEEAGAREADTRGPGDGTRRVERGGSWQIFGEICRVAIRGTPTPEQASPYTGFRIVRND